MNSFHSALDCLDLKFSSYFRFFMQVEIKTTSSSGMLFYVADRRHNDFAALFMKDGHIIFKFNLGSGPARLKSPKTYNDGAWHKVQIFCNVAFFCHQWIKAPHKDHFIHCLSACHLSCFALAGTTCIIWTPSKAISLWRNNMQNHCVHSFPYIRSLKS